METNDGDCLYKVHLFSFEWRGFYGVQQCQADGTGRLGRRINGAGMHREEIVVHSLSWGPAGLGAPSEPLVALAERAGRALSLLPFPRRVPERGRGRGGSRAQRPRAPSGGTGRDSRERDGTAGNGTAGNGTGQPGTGRSGSRWVLLPLQEWPRPVWQRCPGTGCGSCAGRASGDERRAGKDGLGHGR